MNTKDPTEDHTKKDLSNRQRDALLHVAAADSIAEGARRAGVSRSTIYRWM